MSNKYWKEELNKNNEPLYVLYFRPFDDEKELIRFAKDKDGDYIYVSDLLNVEDDLLNDVEENISIEEAKQICEQMIEEHYEDEIAYNELLLRLFREE